MSINNSHYAKSPKEYSDKYLREKFFVYMRRNAQMPQDFLNEIKKRASDLMEYIEKPAVLLSCMRFKKPMSQMCNRIVLDEYKACKNTGKPISDELHAELAKRFPEKYDVQNRRIFRKPVEHKETYVKKTCDTPKKHKEHTKEIRTQMYNPTIWPKSGVYNVSVKAAGKSTQAIQYKNVYVNGHLVVQNADALEIKTLVNDSVLAIYCANKNREPQWYLYNNNMKSLMSKFGSHVELAAVNDTPDTLYMGTSARAVIAIAHRQIAHASNERNRFVIKTR